MSIKPLLVTTAEHRRLLRELKLSADRGAFAMACDGQNREPAQYLERMGWAEWKGENFGSSFWRITDAGLGWLHAHP